MAGSAAARRGRGPATCRWNGWRNGSAEVAAAYLSGKITAAGNPDIYHVIVHAGPEALQDPPPGRGPDARPGVSAETPDDPPAPRRVPAETRTDDCPAPRRVPAETPDDGPADGPAPRPAGHPAHPQRCHLDDGPAISPAAARAIVCHATMSWMLHDHDGTLLDAGLRHRRATPALRRAVRDRAKAGPPANTTAGHASPCAHSAQIIQKCRVLLSCCPRETSTQIRASAGMAGPGHTADRDRSASRGRPDRHGRCLLRSQPARREPGP